MMALALPTLALLLLLLSLVYASADNVIGATPNAEFVPWNDSKYPLVEWIRKKRGGYVSDKIQLRSRPRSNDENGPIDFGWFAIDDISQGEVLMIIPVDAYIDNYIENDEEDDEEDEEKDPLCLDISTLVQEYENGKESPYYVLASFILDKDSPGSMRNRQPGFWSKEAKTILWNIMLDEFLHPDEDESNLSYQDDCGWNVRFKTANTKTKQLHEEAFRYFIANANGNLLFPLHDLIPHRNGKWRNTDIKREWNGRVVVKAYKEIPNGGQLYKSFNRCDFEDGGCDDWDQMFVATQDILRGTGRIEDYPRRWIVVAQPGNEDFTSVFDIDKKDDGTFQVTWKSGPPNLFVVNFMKAHFEAFEKKEATIREAVTKLQSAFERDTILQFLEAYKEALNLGWIHRNGDQSNRTPQLDPFEEPKGLLTRVDDYFMCYIDRDCAGRDFDNTFITSHYQEMKWKSCPELDNSCLTLDGIIQSCTSFRPHYHESFVHIPAQYAKEMKRVAFLGGGDNLLLYEILKYPDLEKVVGLELDQTVVRYAFKHFGASPFFHDPRMEWWFGDASKSFLALPKEYYGSFDLVIVDLLSFIADTLKVTDELTLMEAAGLLMKRDGGIIVKQEDFAISMIDDQFAKYTTKMLFRDLPFLCEQTITMGSNSVDFFHAPRYNHHIETFVRDDYLVHSDGGESDLPFPAWNEYYRVPDYDCDQKQNNSMEEPPTPPTSSRFGVLLIIEAEDLTLLESIKDYRAKVSIIATQTGLSPVDVSDDSTITDQDFLVMLQEGYIVARPHPESKYIGFDVMLWDELQKLDVLKKELIVGFGGSLKNSSSSFRIVSGGMSGIGDGVCQKETLSTIAADHRRMLCSSQNSSEGIHTDSLVHAIVVRDVVSSFISNDSPKVLLILCGDEGTACASLDGASGDENTVFLSLYSCSPTLEMNVCQTRLQNLIQDGVAKSAKLDGIIVDASASIQTCQMLHRFLSRGEVYDAMLKEKYLVLTSVSNDEGWRSLFVDRFRTELGAFFAPSHRADFRLRKDKHEIEWRIFASGCEEFFLHLSDVLSNVTEKTKWAHSLDAVENGNKRFVVDFVPSKTLRDEHYNKTMARNQWNSQHPVGYQIVAQMQQIPARMPFEQGERVLVNTLFDGPWDKIYEPAIVKRVHDNGVIVQYEVETRNGDKQEEVKHEHILRAFSKRQTQSDSFQVGDIVLYDTGAQGIFVVSMISKVHRGAEYFDLAKLGIDGIKYYNVSKSRLMSESESPDLFTESPTLSRGKLLAAFQHALLQLRKSMSTEEAQNIAPDFFTIGDGMVATAFWSHGNSILKWNGETRVEINLFLDREDRGDSVNFRNVFTASVGSLATVMLDEFPRGYGQIVNFPSQLSQPPLWIKNAPSRRH
ncbi:spermine synthase [Nitzschia inconspicua]|uniref:Spermine synthase n=1 Tax=Nitzschia inconspicua TaxID=303405 RepID=A0A9K3KCA5_9STRA|nr:spermine synthase [Nitzschia inconspicua]